VFGGVVCLGLEVFDLFADRFGVGDECCFVFFCCC